MLKPEVIVVNLANGDVALFVNSDAIYQLDASESGESPSTIGEHLAKAMGVELQSFSMGVPSDEEWSWNDVYELLPPAASIDQGKLIAETIEAMSEPQIEKLIDDAAEDALNAGCLRIQQAIKQTDGGIASVVFSGDELRGVLRTNFKNYFDSERAMHEKE